MPIAQIQDNDRRERFVATAGQTVFPYDFPIYAATDLQVRRERSGVITTLIYGADYSVTGAQNQTGGNVVLTAGATLNDIIVILSNMPTARTGQFVNGGDLSAAALEAEFNRNRILIQQNYRDGRNALLFPPTDPTMQDLPPIALRANRFLAFDMNGQPYAAVPTAGTVLDAISRLGDNMSGPLGFTSGTAAAPGLRPNNDNGSGFFQPAPGSIGVAINAVEVARFIPGGLEFVPPGVGAQNRTVQSKLRDFMSARDFGAIGDGAADDTLALQTAVNAAISLGKALFIPSGSYRLTNKISGISGTTAFCLNGEGRGVTKLIWTASATNGGGIEITYTDAMFPPEVKDLSLYTQAVGLGTALKITGPEAASVTQLGPVVESLQVQGEQPVTHCWDFGIHFVTCWYLKGTSLNIKGKGEAGSNYTMTAGIRLTSCQVSYLSDFNVIHADFGVQETASGGPTKGEGLTMKNFEMVGVGTGIDLRADAVAPGTNIGPGHINSHFFGLNLANQYQTKIHDLLLYKVNIGGPTDWVGIQMADCQTNHVHNNLFHGWDYAINSTIGIILSGTTTSDFNQIHHNTFYNFFGATKIGVLLGSGAGNNVLDHNVCTDGTVLEPVRVESDAEKNNYFFRNFPCAIQTFAANAATPSVGNDLSGHWNTANSSPTTVTNFLNGYTGQVITVLVNDSQTLFQHNANLILRNGANYSAPNGAIITFRRDATLWREMSRSV
jgi:hypothetical protein